MCKVGQTGVRMSDMPCFVGIDVATAQLDIALRPSGERWAVPNDASGAMTLVDRVQARHPTLMVLEATGGLERAVTSAWATAGRPVVVVHPRQVRDVARATGLLATRFNPQSKVFYERLLAAGKVKKVALTACMHKLLTILHAMLKHRTPWQPQEVQR